RLCLLADESSLEAHPVGSFFFDNPFLGLVRRISFIDKGIVLENLNEGEKNSERRYQLLKRLVSQKRPGDTGYRVRPKRVGSVSATRLQMLHQRMVVEWDIVGLS